MLSVLSDWPAAHRPERRCYHVTMPDLPIPRSENQGERTAAFRAYRHPADEIGPFDAEHAHAGVEIFARLVYMCMPDPKSRAHGGGDRWKASYRRMVALVYLISPEVFEGMTEDEIARELEMSPRGFDKQLAAARLILAMRRTATPKRG
jgi:hypothetical protein